MIVVYSLKADQRVVDQVQHATRTTENFGIEPTDGMFGSDEWWSNIESGRLPMHTLRGTINDVYMGSMGDWPEFKMLSESGEESRWTREMNSAEHDGLYRVGARIEIDYVWQRHRPKSLSGGAAVRQVIAIRIEEKKPAC